MSDEGNVIIATEEDRAVPKLLVDERSGSEILNLINRLVDGADSGGAEPNDLVIDSEDAITELNRELREISSEVATTGAERADQDDQEAQPRDISQTIGSREAPKGIDLANIIEEQPVIKPDPRYVPIEIWDEQQREKKAPPAVAVSPERIRVEQGQDTTREIRLREVNGRRRKYNENRDLEYDDYVPAVLRRRERSLSPMVPTGGRPWSPMRPSNQEVPPRCKTRGTMFGELRPIPFDPRVDPPARTCFNCWQEGHNKQNCPRPHLHMFCFNCGRRGVNMETCPRCSEAYKIFVRNRETSERYKAVHSGAAQDRSRPRERIEDHRVRILESPRSSINRRESRSSPREGAQHGTNAEQSRGRSEPRAKARSFSTTTTTLDAYCCLSIRCCHGTVGQGGKITC